MFREPNLLFIKLVKSKDVNFAENLGELVGMRNSRANLSAEMQVQKVCDDRA